MVEHVETADGKVRLTPPRTIKANDNFVATGAQGRKGDQLLAAGVPITFAQMALAASCGLSKGEVFRKPSVAILTTGDEIVPIDEDPRPGQIRNSNAAMLASLVASVGGSPWILPKAADNEASLEQAFRQAVSADMLLVTGGVSAGKYDLVEPTLEKLGARFHFTGLRIQPGKPLVFGELPRPGQPDLPFFGLPGNPVSSAVTFLLFGQRIVGALAGDSSPRPRFALARMGEKTDRGGKPGLTRFLPAICDFGAKIDGLPEVNFTGWHGSGDLTALAGSNCFLVVPEEVKYFEPGQIVQVLLY
jgi:molybdopterin molybdotransferase